MTVSEGVTRTEFPAKSTADIYRAMKSGSSIHPGSLLWHQLCPGMDARKGVGPGRAHGVWTAGLDSDPGEFDSVAQFFLSRCRRPGSREFRVTLCHPGDYFKTTWHNRDIVSDE